jgi:hypothetical protein
MGKLSKSKGKRGEREVVALARAAGLDVRRSWELARHPDPATRRCDCLAAGRPAQVKVSADGFAQLYAGLGSVEVLFVRTDRRQWLAVLPAEPLLASLSGARGKRLGNG